MKTFVLQIPSAFKTAFGRNKQESYLGIAIIVIVCVALQKIAPRSSDTIALFAGGLISAWIVLITILHHPVLSSHDLNDPKEK